MSFSEIPLARSVIYFLLSHYSPLSLSLLLRHSRVLVGSGKRIFAMLMANTKLRFIHFCCSNIIRELVFRILHWLTVYYFYFGLTGRQHSSGRCRPVSSLMAATNRKMHLIICDRCSNCWKKFRCFLRRLCNKPPLRLFYCATYLAIIIVIRCFDDNADSNMSYVAIGWTHAHSIVAQ